MKKEYKYIFFISLLMAFIMPKLINNVNTKDNFFLVDKSFDFLIEQNKKPKTYIADDLQVNVFKNVNIKLSNDQFIRSTIYSSKDILIDGNNHKMFIPRVAIPFQSEKKIVFKNINFYIYDNIFFSKAKNIEVYNCTFFLKNSSVNIKANDIVFENNKVFSYNTKNDEKPILDIQKNINVLIKNNLFVDMSENYKYALYFNNILKLNIKDNIIIGNLSGDIGLITLENTNGALIDNNILNDDNVERELYIGKIYNDKEEIYPPTVYDGSIGIVTFNSSIKKESNNVYFVSHPFLDIKLDKKYPEDNMAENLFNLDLSRKYKPLSKEKWINKDYSLNCDTYNSIIKSNKKFCLE